MNKIELSFRDDQSHFRPGEHVEFTVSLQFDEIPERIELRVLWNTQGKGDTDLEEVDRMTLNNPPLQETRQIAYRLPRSPHSFSGKLISLVWAIEAIAFPMEESCRLEIVIAPDAQEIQL